MLTTVFHEWHREHGARLVDFAGWHMPVQYTSITREHHAVRRQAGLFDIAHMGRLWFDGPDACRLLDRLLTADVAALRPGQARYALICAQDGGTLDDVLVYRLAAGYLLVVNASNRTKIVDWIERQRAGSNVAMQDRTFEWAMVAVQGPRAAGVVAAIVGREVTSLKPYTAAELEWSGATAIVSRTGYTGEDGFELIVPATVAVSLWEQVVASPDAVAPCGLGCRDTLRLEAGMPLYGHELDETIDPLTAGLGFAVTLEKEEFVGREALRRISESQPQRRRVGLRLEGRRIAREGAAILSDGEPIGRVTSGTFSPTLERSIAMGYVAREFAEPGRRVTVDIRGQHEAAELVSLPFYRRAR